MKRRPRRSGELTFVGRKSRLGREGRPSSARRARGRLGDGVDATRHRGHQAIDGRFRRKPLFGERERTVLEPSPQRRIVDNRLDGGSKCRRVFRWTE
jgi:hypothetical protein